jgi:hypothetical protein
LPPSFASPCTGDKSAVYVEEYATLEGFSMLMVPEKDPLR